MQAVVAQCSSHTDISLDNDEAREFSTRVRDVGQQLATRNVKQGVSINEGMTTYDASCHLLYGQKAGDASLKDARRDS